MRFFSSRLDQTSSNTRPVIVLGSSSSEVLDYVFEKSGRYYPFWASGWTARGLAKPESKIYISRILERAPRDALVLLNFGLVDVMFSARRKAATYGFYDFDSFKAEMIAGVTALYATLQDLGFFDVKACSLSPVIHLSDTFWAKSPTLGRQLPCRMMGSLYFDFYKELSDLMPSITLFDKLAYGSERGHLLRNNLRRAYEDHHPDYIKIQDLVADALSEENNDLPFRKNKLDSIYKSQSYLINALKEKAISRPNTQR